MSTRILANDDDEKGETGAILFDGTTGRAYGRRFDDYEQADAFVRWVMKHDLKDPARMNDESFEQAYDEFLVEWNACGLTEEESETLRKLEVWAYTANSEPGHKAREEIRRLHGKVREARLEKFEIE